MATFTLDEIREAADKKYASVTIPFERGTLVMTNAIRLPKVKRDELKNLQKRLNGSTEDGESLDQAELMAEAIGLVATDPVIAKEFLEVVGEDLAILATVFAKYVEGTQVGEA